MALLLTRGMLAGLFAGLLSALFASLVGGGAMDDALRFEHGGMIPAEASTGTRPGLFLAGALYGAGLGGLFAVVFACCLGRVGPREARRLAALLAAAAFVVVYLVPALKYPPSPPGYELAETIAVRTSGYFQMVAVSLLAGVLALVVAARGGRGAGLMALAAYALVVGLIQPVLPVAEAVAADYPGDLLWRFRAASGGTQFVLWAALGIAFGHFATRMSREGRTSD